MEIDLDRVVDSFQGRKVVVLGEAILDVYLHGSAGRLCREAPIPVVEVQTRDEVPGGAANTAVNIRRLGGRVRLLSVTGDDDEGVRLRRALARCGVADDDLLSETARATLAKHRLIGDGQTLARFDQGSRHDIAADTQAQLIAALAQAAVDADAIIVSDYDGGLITPRVRQALAALQQRLGRILVVDSGRCSAYAGCRVTALKPSYDQALALLEQAPAGKRQDRAEAIARQGPRLLERAGARIVAVTLDAEGAVILEQGRPPYRTYARPAAASRTTGGGDTFAAALALSLAAGADTASAAELASAAAAVVVGKEGTAACSAQELRDRIAGGEKRLTDPRQLRDRLDYYRGQGRRLVFTNGCFDILHRGHVALLNKAKSLGDVLIVGINSDASVRRLKGLARPINSLEDRVKVLAALSNVDHIIAFDDDTPAEIIRAVRPDIFVKGGDYSRETLPEAPLVESLGGAVCILPLTADRSTSRIIDRIKEAMG